MAREGSADSHLISGPFPLTSIRAIHNRVAVVLDLEEYRRLIERLEELEDIRAYDEAKATEDEIIPFEQAIEEIEHQE